ncbi:MAG: hypothetical protein WCL53_02380 [Chloroflexota bacterium]
MARDSRSRKVGPGLVALGSAAIVAVYATGYIRSEPTEAAVIAAATEAARQSLAQSPLVIPSQTAAPTQTSNPTATTTQTGTATARPAVPTATSSTSTGVQAATPTKAPISAPTPAPTPVKTATPVPTQVVSNGTYRDGTYSGSGTSRHGGIDVTVVVNGGRIVSAEISRCSTRYPCSYIEELPGDVVTNQKVTARYISGATDSSRAYAQAVSAALAKAG